MFWRKKPALSKEANQSLTTKAIIALRALSQSYEVTAEQTTYIDRELIPMFKRWRRNNDVAGRGSL